MNALPVTVTHAEGTELVHAPGDPRESSAGQPAQSVARSLARSLGLVYVPPGSTADADISLVMGDSGLWLRDNRQRGVRLLQADFEIPESRSKKQLLGRAIGRGTRSVVDATAGWGHDSRRLCAMGYTVTAVERNRVMVALLEDAARRARRAGRTAVPEIVRADSIAFLAARSGHWDCVYLDPMFPPKPRGSTLARRPLRLLRELVGGDADRAELFDAARLAAAKRVVVKRPDHIDPAFGDPDETLAGKLVCYDVYHLPGRTQR